MALGVEGVIWYVVLCDSLFCNFVAWFKQKWYKKVYKRTSKYFPLTKAWAISYLLLVLWVGYALYRLGIIVW